MQGRFNGGQGFSQRAVALFFVTGIDKNKVKQNIYPY